MITVIKLVKIKFETFCNSSQKTALLKLIIGVGDMRLTNYIN